METLNERIKQLRKDKGLTQSQLADQLGVTDKAVSKWEVGEANPDISLLVKISQVFNVTIDYLLTGKVEETISLDDMDAAKRALYLIKKDDATNFEKYGYTKTVDVFAEPYGREDRQALKMLEAIYENESVRIFSHCLKKSLEKHLRSGSQNVLLTVQGDTDSFIRLCCKAGSTEGLKAIGMKHFMMGPKTNTKDWVRFHIREGDGPADMGYHTYTLGEDTLDYIFSIPDLSEEIFNYLTEIEFFRDRGNAVYFMADSIILQLYKHGKFERLNMLLAQMREYNQFAVGIYNESLHGSWYTGKRIVGNAIYFLNNSHSDDSYLRAYVYPIDKALTLAIEANDFDWIEKFNEYNKGLLKLLPDIHAHTLSDKEIEVMKMKADKSTPIGDILRTKHVTCGIVNIRGLLGDDYGIDAADGVERIKAFLDRVEVVKPILESCFTSPFEMLLTFAQNKNGRGLFEFAADLQYPELENAVIDGNYDLVADIARKLFIPTKEWMVSLGAEVRRAKAVTPRAWVEDQEEETRRVERQINQQVLEARSKIQHKIIDDYLHRFGRINKELFSKIMLLQFSNAPLDEGYSEPSVSFFQEAKQNLLSEHVRRLEDSLENLTHQKALKADYTRITSELSKEYLLSELGKGEADKVVVLICKRLQIILEYKYGYSGDLFTMIDTLISKTMKLHNCSDDEDNSYDAYQAEDRLFKQRISLLHKLRIKRNNIVHVEHKQVEMSTQEIRECIDLLETLSK